MLQEILAALNGSHTLSAIAVGIIVLLIKALSMLGKALDFHDKHFVEKRHRRLQALRASIKGEDTLTQYLDQSIRLEAFRIASGIRASTLKAEALITLINLGYWDAGQVRRISRYLFVTPKQSRPEIKFDIGDKISAWYGLIAGIGLVLLGAFLALTLIAQASPAGLLVGVLLFGVMTFAGGVLASDFGRYNLARRVQSYLTEHPDVFPPSFDIEATLPSTQAEVASEEFA